MRLVIRGGSIIDESGERKADVAIENDTIVEVAERIEGKDVLDATGCVISPGLVDLHTHMREPGRTEAETVETASRAAALGGYTAVVAMPNTEPAIDTVDVVEDVRRAARNALCEVRVAAAITMGRRGERLVDMEALVEAGVRIFTDDGDGVQSAGLARSAMVEAARLDVVIAEHSEDATLSAGGVMHEGAVSKDLGLAGIPALAEEVMVMRDIALARATGARLHLLHTSTAGAVAMASAARAQGVRVTTEVAPHHFTLTDEEARKADPVFRVNPPLRSEAHRRAVVEALRSGEVDAIATDHAPHTDAAKGSDFAHGPCGMLGLETALALGISELDMSLQSVLAMFSWQPASIAGLERHGRPIAVGQPANIVVFDPNASWTIERDRLASKSRNTPYHGRAVTGRVRHTICEGELVVRNEEAVR